jgi:hypothetical protein
VHALCTVSAQAVLHAPCRSPFLVATTRSPHTGPRQNPSKGPPAIVNTNRWRFLMQQPTLVDLHLESKSESESSIRSVAGEFRQSRA